MNIPMDELKRLQDGLTKLNPKSKDYIKHKERIASEEYAILHNENADPSEVAGVCKWICQYCGQLIMPKVYQRRPKGVPGLGMWIRPTNHGCRAEKDALRKISLQEKQRQADESAALWNRRLKHAGLEGRLAECTFGNFISRDDWQGSKDVKEQILEYTKLLLSGELSDKNWLVLTGPVGTGKSHLAAAVIREALIEGKTAYFRSWTSYLKRIQASWDKRGNAEAERESDILAELERGWLVVIDDLDKRRSTEWVKGILYSFINQRYTNNLPTIITLNTSLTAVDKAAPGRLALHDIMGGAVLDRTIESMWKYIEFDGPSYRSGQKWRY